MIPFISCSYSIGAHTVLNKGWRYENVTISQNKIYFVEEGEMVVETKNTKIVARRGDLVLIPSYSSHTCYLTELNYAKKYWVHFSLKQGSQDFFLDYNLPVVVRIGDFDKVEKIFIKTLDATLIEEPMRSLKTTKGIYELIIEFLSKCKPITEKTVETQIDQAIKHVNLNYHENFSLEELAKDFGYTPNHFIKKFKEKTGYTPIKYVIAKRIEEAKRLLEYTKLPVSEIMEKVGFLDAAYFSKVFKKSIGYSPKNFREMLKRSGR